MRPAGERLRCDGGEKEVPMQTHELDVVIPEDHRLTVEIPDTIRSGPARMILVLPTEEPDHSAVASTGDEMDRLYAELRALMARSSTGSEHEQQIQDHFIRLRKLQEKEADALEARFRAQRRLRPGEGHEALERAQRIIANFSR
jgi:hypothetical protein